MNKYENDVRRIVNDVLTCCDVAQLDGNDSLINWGMNSIIFIQIVGNIEDFFGIIFKDDRLLMEEGSTINKLVESVGMSVSQK